MPTPVSLEEGAQANWSGWKSGEASQAAGQLIVFDTDSDGGVRMEANEINFAAIKSRLSADQSMSNAKERCQLYVQMFNHGPQFNSQEYEGLGCKDYPPESFPVL